MECFNLERVESVGLEANIDNRILIHYRIQHKNLFLKMVSDDEEEMTAGQCHCKLHVDGAR